MRAMRRFAPRSIAAGETPAARGACMAQLGVVDIARAAPVDAARVDAAHRALLADRSIQFDLPAKPPRVSEPPPEWLESLGRAIGRLVEWVGGGWSLLLWGAGIVLAATLLFLLAQPLRDWWRERQGGTSVAEPQWAPEAATARALLEEADALAAAGRFAEAVHLLLFRSIDDIARWRGELVRPSFTSRDIARADALPGAARSVFAGIVAAVERSLFGGAALERGDWERARGDYAGFALRANG